MREQAAFLDYVTNPAPQSIDVIRSSGLAIELDRTVGDLPVFTLQQAANRFQGRALSGPVGAQQRVVVVPTIDRVIAAAALQRVVPRPT